MHMSCLLFLNIDTIMNKGASGNGGNGKRERKAGTESGKLERKAESGSRKRSSIALYLRTRLHSSSNSCLERFKMEEVCKCIQFNLC